MAAMSSQYSAHAQFAYDYLGTADKYYAKGDYYSASIYYEKYLSSLRGKDANKTAGYDPYVVQQPKGSHVKTSSHQQAVYHLAESYRLLNNQAKAEPVYKTTLSFDSTQFPLRYYWYGVSLRANNKFDDAKVAFETFIKGYTKQDSYAASANKEIANLQFIHEQTIVKETNKYSIGKVGGNINAKGASYAAVWQGDKLVFTSTRPDSTTPSGNGSPYNNKLYEGGLSNSATKTNIPNEGNIQYGVASFTPDNKKIFLTRWQNINGKNIAAIYTSIKITDSSWDASVLLDSNINKVGYSSQQPFITTDGKYLLFSSTIPGGYGKYDLWYVTLDTKYNVSSKPINLGSSINTVDDDEAPYYHLTKNTLLFASNGRVGMGGFDLYKSKGFIGGDWQSVSNLGYPINSIKDDIYFTNKGNSLIDDAVISSDRASECCLELFAIKKLHVDKYITGRILDCDSMRPLNSVHIVLTDSITKANIQTLTTDNTGRYTFTISDYKELNLLASKEKYNSNHLSFFTPSDIESDSLSNMDICLSLIPIPKDSSTPELVIDSLKNKIVLNTVYFDFDKSNLTKEAKISLDSILSVLKKNPNIVLEINGHTDSEGSDIYNLDLSIKRARACAVYLISKGIKASRLQLKGSGESEPIAPNIVDGKDNPAGRKMNRCSEFKITHE